MKKLLFISLVAILFYRCSNGQTQSTPTSLSATEFAAKLEDFPTATILDVRTPEEFSKGHLVHAVNIDLNGLAFENQLASLDKSKPVFVYCLSGGRSSTAANIMHSAGFKEVYELSGGILKWRGANFPETTDKIEPAYGMSKPEFEALLQTDRIVLIDFYADWCAPCKKMKPYIDKIERTMADRVLVVRINADDHQWLCKELNIDALPVLQLYKGSILTWSNTGYIGEAEVVRQLQ